MKESQRKYTKSEKGKLARSRAFSKYIQKVRSRIFIVLNPVCVKCGFSDIRALQLDHINGNGRKDMKRLGGNALSYLYYSKHLDEAKQNLQVLCANCNVIKKYINREGVKYI